MQELPFNQPIGQVGNLFSGMFQQLEQDFQQVEQEVAELAEGNQGFSGSTDTPFAGGGFGNPGGCDPFGQSQGAGLNDSFCDDPWSSQDAIGGNGFGSPEQNSFGLFGGQEFGRSDWCGNGPEQPFSATNNGNGQASIDLGNGDKLTLNKANSEWTLTDGKTGAVTDVSGDPHVNENGQNWTFKNDMTFQLTDGTRVTVHTVPYGNGQTLSNQLDITRGGLAMQVTGLAQNSDTPLQITQGFDGRQLAASNFGDPTVYESGNQWQAGNGQVVDANYATANL